MNYAIGPLGRVAERGEIQQVPLNEFLRAGRRFAVIASQAETALAQIRGYGPANEATGSGDKDFGKGNNGALGKMTLVAKSIIAFQHFPG